MCEVVSFKNFENSLTTVKVMTKNKVAPFYLGHDVVLWEQMSLKQTSETVSAKRRIAQIITQWVPGSQASNSECPTPRWAEAVSRYNQVMTPSRTKMPSTGHIRDGNAAVHQVPGSLVMEAVMHHRHEFKVNLLRGPACKTNLLQLYQRFYLEHSA